MFPVKAASAILEPLLFLNEIHSCVNMSERVQEKHHFSLAQHTLILSQEDLGLLAPSKKEFSKPVALTEMSFLTRSDLSDEKKI